MKAVNDSAALVDIPAAEFVSKFQHDIASPVVS